MNPIPTTPVTPEPAPRHEIYIPGYRWAKLGLAIFGAILIAVALYQYRLITRLAFTGEKALAEAVQVVLVDAAGNETVLRDDAEVKVKVDEIKTSRDRSQVFWIDYRFTAAGKPCTVRSPIGQVMRPLHALKDEDGLPRSITLWYDPANPKTVAIPFQFLRASGAFITFGLSTCFVPGMLLLFGMAGVLVGLLLWYNANKPIEMPDLSQAHGELDKRHPTPH
jgi:hypothetical protein